MSLSCATTLPSCTSDRQNARRPSVQASCRQSCAQSSTPKVNGAKQQRLDSALSVRHLKADSRVKASSPQADAPTVSSKAEQDLTVQDAITRIRSIIATGNELTPFDRSSFNLAVVIWCVQLLFEVRKPAFQFSVSLYSKVRIEQIFALGPVLALCFQRAMQI